MTDQLQNNLTKANQIGKHRFALSLSVGAVLCRPDDVRCLKELMAREDESMYQQKRVKRESISRKLEVEISESRAGMGMPALSSEGHL